MSKTTSLLPKQSIDHLPLHTPEALPAILETLLQEGYTFVPISELILPGEYNVTTPIDHTGRQLPAQPSSSPRLRVPACPDPVTYPRWHDPRPDDEGPFGLGPARRKLGSG